jgi:hypothetical protein
MQRTITITVPRWQTILKVVFIFALCAGCLYIGYQFHKPQKTVVTKIVENPTKKDPNAFVVDRVTNYYSYGHKDLSDNHRVQVNDKTMWGFEPGEQIQFPSSVDIHTTYTHDGQVIGEGEHQSTGETTVKFTDTGIESSTTVKDQVVEAITIEQQPKLWEIGIEGSMGTEVSMDFYVQRDFPIYRSEHIDINAYLKGSIGKNFTDDEIEGVITGGICGRFGFKKKEDK